MALRESRNKKAAADDGHLLQSHHVPHDARHNSSVLSLLPAAQRTHLAAEQRGLVWNQVLSSGLLVSGKANVPRLQGWHNPSGGQGATALAAPLLWPCQQLVLAPSDAAGLCTCVCAHARVGLSLGELLQHGAEEEDHRAMARDPVETAEAALAPEHVHGQWNNHSVKGRRTTGEKMKCQ